MQKQVEFYQNKLAYEMDPADLYEALATDTPPVVVDARQPSGYEREHIPGAINLPHREMTTASTQHLDRSKVYVCYCDGIGCNASTKGALKMTQLGFQVKELIGGLDWWKRDGYATQGSHPTEGADIQCAC